MPTSLVPRIASRVMLPATEVVLEGIGTPLGGLSISASNDTQLAILITAIVGTLYAATFPGAAISGGGTHSIWIAGSPAEVNAKLATLVYAAPAAGADILTVTLVDATGQTAGPASLPIDVVPLLTPTGRPSPTATILGGTLTLDTRHLDGITLAVHDAQTGAGAATVILVDTTLGPNATLDIASSDPRGAIPRIAIAGQVTLQGMTTLNAGPALITLARNATLANTGQIAFRASSAQITGAGTLRNDGTIAIAAAANPNINVVLTGSGIIALGAGASLSLGAPVGADETIDFADGTGILSLAAPATMHATIAGFVPGDQIQLGEINVDAVDYIATAGGGTLTLFDGAHVAASLNFAGAHRLSDFRLSVATDSAPDGGAITTLSVLASPLASPAGALEVYRFFDNVTGTQLLTQDAAERDSVLATRPDLNFEGVAMRATTADDPAAAPVYRFFDTHTGTHFFTASDVEKAALLSSRPDLVFEPGSTIWEHTAQQSGDMPVFRFFDTTIGTHFNTASATERASILSTRLDLTPEGIAFFVPGR